MQLRYRANQKTDGMVVGADRIHTTRFGRNAAFALGVAIASCSPLLDKVPGLPIEGVAQAQTAPPEQVQSDQPVQTGTYNPQTNPLSPNQRLKDIASSLSGSNKAKAQTIFDRLNKSAPGGVKVVDGAGRPPRTAVETLAQGGDCTELATVVVSIMKEANIPGGAMVVHFSTAPADTDHMIPYILDGGKKIIVDLQADSLGATAQGTPTVLLSLTLDQSIEMYHREMGDDFRDKGKAQDAIKAYKRSVEIFDGDAYVHQNLGVLYEKANRMEDANRHYKRAAELNPAKYAKEKKRGSYNEELQKGEKAYKEKRWEACVTHFTNALESGEKISSDERSAIESFREYCKKKLAK
jgi:tetratricopeptide (TPR) repeat protein